jgi:hypothetical protein
VGAARCKRLVSRGKVRAVARRDGLSGSSSPPTSSTSRQGGCRSASRARPSRGLREWSA